MITGDIRNDVKTVAEECYRKGPGFAQEGIVMRTLRERFHPRSVQDEQAILDCWHALFRDGELVWGYNLDNPAAPFYHVRVPSQT
jgi:hypothetical protein